MSPEILSILVLAVMFVIATALPINMGVLAFVGAGIVGTLVAGLGTDEIIAGFPGDLFLTLVGITYLFAIAQNNGTIDLLVQTAVRVVGGRVAAIPWIMFLVAAVLTGVGAVSPGAVAIVAPIALGFAARYGINPLLMGLMVVHGAQAGGFTPSSIYGGITNGVVENAGLPINSTVTMLASFGVNAAIALLLFLVLGRGLLGRRESDADAGAAGEGAGGGPAGEGAGGGAVTAAPAVTPQGGPGAFGDAEGEAEQGAGGLATAEDDQPAGGGTTGPTPYRLLTIVGLFSLALLTPAFSLSSAEVGFVAISIGLLLALVSPHLQRRATGQITWPEILLITGVATYVEVLEVMGTIDYVGETVAGFGSPLVAALLLCFIGAIVSAFASSTAVLGSIIPLAVPFLQGGSAVGAVGFVAALAVSSTVVDVSPFSTNGALVLANARGIDRDVFFRQLLAYGAIITLVAPPVLWLLFVVPGWL